MSSRKFFCKESCRQEDILIETEDVNAQNDRFSIEWKKRGYSSNGDFFVGISQPKKSDSGRYRCGEKRTSTLIEYMSIELIVVDARLDKYRKETLTLYPKTSGSITVECSFPSLSVVTEAYLCRDICWTLRINKIDEVIQKDRHTIRFIIFKTGGSVFVSISQLNQSDSGRYTCGFRKPGFTDLQRTFEVNVTNDPLSTDPKDPASPESPDQPGASTTDILLYVGGTLAALVVLFSIALLIFCRRKSLKPKGPPKETEYESVSEAKYTKPNSLEICGEDRSIPPSAVEDDSGKVTYSEINFSGRAAQNSAPDGHADTVIYSTPR